MKKFVILLVALLVATAFAFAVEDASDTTDVEDNGTVIAFSPTVQESDTAVGDTLVEEPAAMTVVRKPIARLHLIGNGIAVSGTDAFSFMHARIVVGAVKVKATATDANSAFTINRAGVLMLDAERYHLKDIAVSTEEVSAEIFGPVNDTNSDSNSPVGEIKVKRFEKPGRDIWAGNMVLNGKAYNVYFLGVKRNFRLAEITEKIGDYCKENSDDSRCKRAMVQCASDPEECKEKAKNYCEENPTNLGCLQLKKAYCLMNATDERCRGYLEGLCEKYPSLNHCAITDVNDTAVVSINTNAVSETTIEEGEKLGDLIRSKIRSKIRSIVNSIETIESTGAGWGD